jgi:TPR repeat protein
MLFARPYSWALFRALGAATVERKAREGDGAAQYSQGCMLMRKVEGAVEGGEGAPLGTAGRSPMADVGLTSYTAQFPVAHKTELWAVWSPDNRFCFCGYQPWAEAGTALLEKAAGQGHVYAMFEMGCIHHVRQEHEQAVEWFTKGAHAGLPKAMYNLRKLLAKREGVAAPDLPAAADWYRRAVDNGIAAAAYNLVDMYSVGRGRGVIEKKHSTNLELTDRVRSSLIAFTLRVRHDAIFVECLFSMTLLRGATRSKQMAMRWMRKAAENGSTESCLHLAARMYGGWPYAREVGHVGEAAGVAASAGIMEGHDVPPDVLTGIVHWLRKGGHDPVHKLDEFRTEALVGAPYCRNEGCEVVGHLKEFKVCPQCKTARYCGDACQKEDWTTGGHKEKCGTFAQGKVSQLDYRGNYR